MCVLVHVSPPHPFKTVCHNVADKVLIWLQLTLIYSTTREMDMDGGKGKAEGGNGWMDRRTERLECVYKQFSMATFDEPIICQRLSEYERKGNMDGKWRICWQQSLTQQHSHKT